MDKSKFYHEAKGVFLNEKYGAMKFSKFYAKDKFALVIDLRAFNDNDVAWNGRRIVNTQSGILLEITKEGGDSLIDCYCTIYVVSDALVNITNRSLQSFVY